MLKLPEPYFCAVRHKRFAFIRLAGVQNVVPLCAYFTKSILVWYKTVVDHTLLGLVDETKENKRSVQNNYWLYPAYAPNSTDNAWNINMNNGQVNQNNQNNNNGLWAVRSGEWSC